MLYRIFADFNDGTFGMVGKSQSSLNRAKYYLSKRQRGYILDSSGKAVAQKGFYSRDQMSLYGVGTVR